MAHSINTDHVSDIFQKGSYLNYVIGGVVWYVQQAVLFVVINPFGKNVVNLEDF